MELIKGVSDSMKVSVPPSATVLPVEFFDANGESVGNATPVENANGVLTIPVPYEAVATEGERSAKVTFLVGGSEFEREVYFNVATPYMDLHEVKDLLGSGTSSVEAFKAEAAARNIINVFCGQSFGHSTKTLEVMASDTNVIPLPEHLIRLDRLEEAGITVFDRDDEYPAGGFFGDDVYAVSGSGWFIQSQRGGVHTWTDREEYSVNPIRVPSAMRNQRFKENLFYNISGEFGYRAVPSEVREAAALLIEDYSCMESIYRDKFIKSIDTSSWRAEFHGRAFEDTGNARANILLQPWVVDRMLVI